MFRRIVLGITVVLLLSLMPLGTVASPPNSPDSEATVEDIAFLQEYLRDYGYLGDVEVELGVVDQPTRAALQRFQSFNGLEVTGEPDTATRELMAKPRFDNHPDVVGADFVPFGTQWDKTDLTYGFLTFTPDIPEADTRDAMAEAFGLWSAVTPLTFTEVPVTSASDPDIIILFGAGSHGDPFPFDGQFGVLAHAFFPEQGDISGDAHFDEDEDWTVTIPHGVTEFDLVTVAAHEFGHSLGLDHSEVDDALMAPFYLGPNRFLHADDIAGIQFLYGPGEPPGEDPMFVSAMSLTSETITSRGGATTFALTGEVTVLADGAPVSGATVSANLAGPGTNLDLNSLTNASGVATFNHTASQAGEYTLTVTNVAKDGMTYDALLNVVSSASVNTSGAPPPGDGSMFVNDVNLSSQVVSSGRGGTAFLLTGQVTIHADGAPVSGATVSANLTGPGINQALTSLTNASGVATFNRTVSEPGAYTLTVTNVSKAGMAYDASFNVVTSDSVDTSGGTPPPPPPPPPGNPMYVSDVDLTYHVVARGENVFYRLNGKVTVLSDDEPVSGATVTARLTGPGLDVTLNRPTNAIGVASFPQNATQTGEYTLTVINVSKLGVIYNENLNLEDSASVTVS